MKHAASNLVDAVKEERLARKRYDAEVDKFYNNKKLFDEYTTKAADRFIKDYPDAAEEYRNARGYPSFFRDFSDRDLILWMFRNDDSSLGGDYNQLDLFMESGDKRASSLVDASETLLQASLNVSKASREYAKEFLGEYGDQDFKIYSKKYPQGIKQNVENIVTSIINQSAYDKYYELYD